MALNDDWLALTEEDTLEPELPICDPHHHLWDTGHEASARFRREQVEPRYLLDQLLADLGSGHNVVSTVFIECAAMYRAAGPAEMRPVGETEFVNGIAAMSASGQYGPTRVAAGIVGFADLNLGDGVAAVLEAHIAAGGGRFRGIRHAASWDASDDVRNSHTNPTRGMLAEPVFRAGLARLAPLGLSFEAWCYHTQIGEVTDLARAFPDTTIILNHFGGPLGIGPYAGRRADNLPQWRLDIDDLAACPNVVAKLGGVNMRSNGFDWHQREKPPSSVELAEATRAYYEHCIERFGPERCLFESNFPVDKVSCGYNVLWNTFKRIAVGCSAAEKAWLFHDTAARVYRLDG
ncbi:MAG: amidohydrolase family protein [Alphaproteobacteria bacterium]|jgi:predicted TIM-barrel fold metal-dependent hydrolase|nr:amidohydrolase family protein [Alphaproteobacteria bacterium]MDP6567943.1 amidohydrolase family protein [Alphaproteobacteria bacterium]MDP6812353.1 amidohydrolase family protein [Alphaproteobacteria bacterium]